MGLQQSEPLSFSLTGKKIPQTKQELLEAPCLQTALDSYNERMRAEDEKWEDRTVEDIETDAELAMALEQIWDESEVTGKAKEIVAVEGLIRGAVEDVRKIDTERILPEEEVIARLSAKGIDLKRIQEESREVYERSGYVEKLKEVGMLDKGEEFEVSIPQFFEREMQVIEDLIKEGKVQLFLDDARLTGLETAEALGLKLSHLGEKALERAEDNTGEEIPSPVRLVLFQDRKNFYTMEREHMKETHEEQRRDMDFGMYARLMHWLKETNPDLADKMTYIDYKDGGERVGIILKEKTANGDHLAAHANGNKVTVQPTKRMKRGLVRYPVYVFGE